MVGQRAAAGGGHLRLDPRMGIAAIIVDGEREAFALAFDQGRIIEQGGEPLAVERRRHGEQAEVGPQPRRRIERQRKRQVAVEAALVDLVEQHRRHAGQLGIGLQAGEEHAVGHGDDPRRPADLAVEPGLVADGRARRFAPLARHKFGGGARGEAARDEQQDQAVAPWLAEQGRCHPRRLARARRRHQQRARAVAERGEQVAAGRRRSASVMSGGMPDR